MTVLVRLQHARQAQYCCAGVREFCARHGLDFTTLRTVGLDEALLVATGDAMALRVVSIARAEADSSSR